MREWVPISKGILISEAHEQMEQQFAALYMEIQRRFEDLERALERKCEADS